MPWLQEPKAIPCEGKCSWWPPARSDQPRVMASSEQRSGSTHGSRLPLRLMSDLWPWRNQSATTRQTDKITPSIAVVLSWVDRRSGQCMRMARPPCSPNEASCGLKSCFLIILKYRSSFVLHTGRSSIDVSREASAECTIDYTTATLGPHNFLWASSRQVRARHACKWKVISLPAEQDSSPSQRSTLEQSSS